MQRRNFLLSSIALAANACTQQEQASYATPVFNGPAACLKQTSIYPTAQEIAEQAAPSDNDRLRLQNYMTESAKKLADPSALRALVTYYGLLENGQKTWSTETNKKRSQLQEEVRQGGWTIGIEVMEVLFGFKHLSVTLRSDIVKDICFRFEGRGAKPQRLALSHNVEIGEEVKIAKHYDPHLERISLWGNSILFGQWYNVELLKSDIRDEIHNFTIDYVTALNFISRAAQFFVAFNAQAIPYQLWQQNSNSFAYSILKHGLDTAFDEPKLKAVLVSQNVSVPGYGKWLMPEMVLDRNLLISSGENAGDVLARIGHVFETSSPWDCLSQAQQDLVRWQLTLMHKLLEPVPEPVTPKPVVSNFARRLAQ